MSDPKLPSVPVVPTPREVPPAIRIGDPRPSPPPPAPPVTIPIRL